jgi:dTDP-glucose 4,6-dehydratase
MVLLVTGVAGFIGTNFIKYYLKKYNNCKILGIDKLTYASNIENINDIDNRFKFIKGDIASKKFVNSLFIQNDIDNIINFAAESHVDRSIKNADIFIKSNIYGVFNLIDCAKQNLLEHDEWKNNFKFLQISTDEVYGSANHNEKFSENSPIHPNNPYSASKASADLLIQSYCNTYKFPGMITRCSNNYGPFQHTEKFIPTIIHKSLNHQLIPIYGDGKQIRDWIHVNDHCSAIDCVLKNGTIGEIYNVGGNNEWYNIDIANLILSIIKDITNDDNINNNLISYINDRPGHDQRYAIDATKIKTKLKWEPTIKFKEGIKSTIKWYIGKPGFEPGKALSNRF